MVMDLEECGGHLEEVVVEIGGGSGDLMMAVVIS